MIVGTAGHIDHGKSTMVEALTGQTMDRLADEQRRGITIDLNFAALDLGDGRPTARHRGHSQGSAGAGGVLVVYRPAYSASGGDGVAVDGDGLGRG